LCTQVFLRDCGGDGAQQAVDVWPQAALQEREPFFGMMSCPAAPSKLRCKLKTRRAVALALQRGVGVSRGAADASGGTAAHSPGGGGTCGTTAQQHTAPAQEIVDPDAAQQHAAAHMAPAQEDMGPDAAPQHAAARMDPRAVAKLNERTLQWVLQQLPAAVQRRYAASARRLEVAADEVVQGGAAEWAARELLFEGVPEASGKSLCATVRLRAVRLTSPTCYTPPGPACSDGVFCCTPLTAAQAFEYIIYDSQRGAVVTAEALQSLVPPPRAPMPTQQMLEELFAGACAAPQDANTRDAALATAWLQRARPELQEQ
jgi:hypothetical protein